MDNITELLAEEIPAAIALRHRLHADPRRSGEEDDTADAVSAAIGAHGQRTATTGRLVRIGPQTGPAIALRAELDGLPLRERSTVSWKSRSDVMHACGHDLHCAALTAIARAARRCDLPAGLLIVLQPREEDTRSGAVDIVADDAFHAHQPAAMIGVHVQPQLAQGQIGLTPGPINAACDMVDIQINGRGGHGAYPHRTDDPVLALAQVIVALHHLVSRRVDPLHAAALSVGTICAGTASNIIPDAATATATLRVLDPTDREDLHTAIRITVAGIAKAYRCRATIAITEVNPVLHNHPRLTAMTARQLQSSSLTLAEFRSCGSDDFAFYSAHMPSVMIFVGTDNGAVKVPQLHSPSFVPGDEIIDDIAAAYLAGLRGALAILQQKKQRADPDPRLAS